MVTWIFQRCTYGVAGAGYDETDLAKLDLK